MKRHGQVFFLILVLFLALFFPLEIHSSFSSSSPLSSKSSINRVVQNWTSWLDSIAKWSLEVRVGSSWVSSSDLTVIETESPSNSLGVNFSIKYTLNFTASVTSSYRLNMTITNLLNGTSRTNNYYLFRSDCDIVFDWSDTASLQMTKTAVMLGTVGSLSKNFSWSILASTVVAGTHITIDPTLIRTQGNARGTSTTTSISVTMSQTPMANNLMVAVIGTSGYDSDANWWVNVTSISETGVVWAKAVSQGYFWRVGVRPPFIFYNVITDIWYGNVSSGASASITVNLSYGGSGHPNRNVANICEYNGYVCPTLDKTASNYGTGATTDTGTTATTSNATEVWVGGATDIPYGQSSPTNSFTLMDGVLTSLFSASYLEKYVTSTGTANSGTSVGSSGSHWSGCIATFMETNPYATIDSYSETNQDSYFSLYALHPSGSGADSDGGQSFTMLSSTYKITLAVFYLKKYGSPTGTAYAVLYAHSGTYGTSSVPTGSALATSDGFDVSTLPSANYSLVVFKFTGAQQFTMSASTYYCIDFQNPTSGTIDASNYVKVGIDGSSPSHGGNSFEYYISSWIPNSGNDACFYVYGQLTTAVNNFVVDLSLSASAGYSTDALTRFNVNDPFSASSSFTSVLTSNFHVDSPFSSSVGFGSVVQALYNVVSPFSASATMTSLANCGFNINSPFSTSASFLSDLQTVFNVVSAFGVSVSFVAVLNGFAYEVVLAFSSSAGFSSLVQSGFNVVSPFTSSASFVSDVLSSFNVVSNFASSVGFGSLVQSGFNIVSSFASSVGFSSLVQSGFNVVSGFSSSVGFSSLVETVFNVVSDFSASASYDLSFGAEIMYYYLTWLVLALSVGCFGGLGFVYWRRRKKEGDLF